MDGYRIANVIHHCRIEKGLDDNDWHDVLQKCGQTNHPPGNEIADVLCVKKSIWNRKVLAVVCWDSVVHAPTSKKINASPGNTFTGHERAPSRAAHPYKFFLIFIIIRI